MRGGAQYGVFRRTIECSTIRCDRFILPREKPEIGADSFDRGRWYSLPCRQRLNNRYDRNMGEGVKLCERLQLCGAANRGLLRATDSEALQDSGGTGDFQVNSAALPRSRRKADRSQRGTLYHAKPRIRLHSNEYVDLEVNAIRKRRVP